MLDFFKIIQEKNLKNIQIIGIGGGYNLNQLLTFPGASAHIDGIYYPYAKEHTMNFIPLEFQDAGLKFVSKEMIHHILSGSPDNTLVITAALPTNRVRQGENHAYIGCRQHDRFFIEHVLFQKEDDRDVPNNYLLRLAYDNALSAIAMELFVDQELGYKDNKYVISVEEIY